MNLLTDIKNQIRDYVIETTYATPEKIKDETSLFKEGVFDSMGFIMLINYIESAFEIKAKDTELLEDNFESINSIAGFVYSKINN